MDTRSHRATIQPRRTRATAILSAFDRYDIVGMNAGHGNEKLDAFILSLPRQPTFAAIVNDIVVECGNRRYQTVLDRYTSDDDVSLAEVRQAWRQTRV